MQPEQFRWGDLAKIATEAGLTRQHLHNTLTGRRNLTPEQAARLVEAAKNWCYQTNVFDWMFPLETPNPLFKKYAQRDPGTEPEPTDEDTKGG